MNTSRFISAAALVVALAIGWQGESAGAEQSRQTTPVPILMYHVIADPTAGAPYPQLYVSESEFAEQMRWLGRHGYHAVTQRAVWDHWHRGRPLPARPIVISFDDGYREVADSALPIMQSHGWPGVLNLTVKNLRVSGGLSQWRVRKLIDADWELASHTQTHPDLPSLSGAALTAEVAGSRGILRSRFGVPVDFFCYPAGRYDARVIDAVRRAGYLGATTTVEGLARSNEAYELERIRVSRGQGAQGLAQALARASS
jgi:peptidoglycan/xylan/chitin deacetylase (PgdA/CDA1 family)